MNTTRSGFTLVEILIVLLLLGIVMAAGVPSMKSSLDNMKLEGAAEEVVSAIQYVQSLAIKEGVAHGMTFFTDTEVFSCNRQTAGNIIRNPLDKKLYEVDFSGEGPLQGVDIVSADFGGMPGFAFDSLGEPTSGGTVVLGYGGMEKTITLSSVVGRVSVQ